MSISIKNISKTFKGKKIINNISFEVKESEILGFLGPNGAGKSTTMKIAACHLLPSEGTIKICGYDIWKESLNVRKQLGYLPENNPLYLDMYVREYLNFTAFLHGLKGKKRNERLNQVMIMVGLESEKKKKIGALSKGYKQRVGLAQALIHDPKVLILDEPTTGLDPNQIVEIRSLIKDISKKKTVILSTHIMQEVQSLCDKTVIIHLGKIVADSKVSQLQDYHKKTQILVGFNSQPDLDAFKTIEGVQSIQMKSNKELLFDVQPGKDIRGDIFRKAVAKNLIIICMEQQNFPLEHIFRKLTMGS